MPFGNTAKSAWIGCYLGNWKLHPTSQTVRMMLTFGGKRRRRENKLNSVTITFERA
jgi:hypothetical protein